MGCTATKPTGEKYQPPARSSQGSARKSMTESKINQALLKKRMEISLLDKPLTFEKILLKFDKLRVVLGYIKTIFEDVAVDGSLDNSGLQRIMKRLAVEMSLDEILDLFDFVNVQEKRDIKIKEFLVALTIGMVLDVIPALSVMIKDDASKDGIPPIKRSFSGFMGHNHEIKEMLNLIVCAYLIFDPTGRGFILRDEVEKMLDEHGPKTGNNSMLSQQRWKEMVRSTTILKLPIICFVYSYNIRMLIPKYLF